MQLEGWLVLRFTVRDIPERLPDEVIAILRAWRKGWADLHGKGRPGGRGPAHRVAGSYWVVPYHRRRGCLLAAIALGVGGLAACSTSENGAGNHTPFVQVKPGYSEVTPAKRKAAPDLKGATLSGSQLALTSLSGKVVVLNFWGSWCGPCRAEASALVTVAKSAGSGVTFVGVDERDTTTNALSFQRTYGVAYPSIVDEDGSLAAHWPGASGPPYTFIIDRQGRVAGRFLGGVTEGELKSAVAKVAAEA